MQKALAEVYALTGENAHAIALLGELPRRSIDVTVVALKHPEDHFDALVVARLFTVLAERELDPAMPVARRPGFSEAARETRGRSLKGERWRDLRLTIRQHPGRG